MAEENGDGEKVKVIQDELNELEERAEALDRQRTKNISAIRYTSDGEVHVLVTTFDRSFILKSFTSSSYINQRNRSWNIVESEKALVVSVCVFCCSYGCGCGLLLKHHNICILQQAEGQNAKNQQMDPFTRRQCKPTMVSNVRFLNYTSICVSC